MSLLCSLFGFSRQAWYAAIKQKEKVSFEFDAVLAEILAIRKRIPGIGTAKLYELLKPFLSSHFIKMGRDKIHYLLKKEGLLVKKKGRRVVTTNSDHCLKKYPNLVKDIIPTETETLWVSDMTYLSCGRGFAYLSLIMDAFSRKIVSWSIQKKLDAKGAVLALKMALKSRTKATQLIHHSDRGVQYCSWAYVDLLRDSNVEISMCSSAEPNENSMAERLNRTLKEDFNVKGFISFCEALEVIERVIKTYNDYRPHASLDYRTPKLAHQSIGSQRLKWYPYKKIRFSNVIRKPVNTA